MTTHGATTREPVYSGARRIPGLYERTLADGSTVYEARLRLGGPVRRHRLTATTKTDAIGELRALQVDYGRGETFRSPATALTVADLAADWQRHLTARIGDRGPRRRYSARTVALTGSGSHSTSSRRSNTAPWRTSPSPTCGDSLTG